MKYLIIHSTTPEEDKAAAFSITKTIVNGEADKIKWFTSLGEEIKDMLTNQKSQYTQLMQLHGRIGDCKKSNQISIESAERKQTDALCRLRDRVVALEKQIEKLSAICISYEERLKKLEPIPASEGK